MFFGISVALEGLCLVCFLCCLGLIFSFFKWKEQNRVSMWHAKSLGFLGGIFFTFAVFLFAVFSLLTLAKGRMDLLQKYVDDDFYAVSTEIVHTEKGVSMILHRKGDKRDEDQVYFWNRTPEYLPDYFRVLNLDNNKDSLYILDRIHGNIVPMIPNKKK